jgi:hypothetical protein
MGTTDLNGVAVGAVALPQTLGCVFRSKVITDSGGR